MGILAGSPGRASISSSWASGTVGSTTREALAAEADAVVSALPLTPQTTGIFDKAFFAALKPGAYFINVGRGRSVVTADLVEALRSGHLAGAGMDVFAVEPLPPDHPLWDMPNVLITPHYSGETVNRSAQPGELFLRNLRAYLAGQPLQHVVDLTRGY